MTTDLSATKLSVVDYGVNNVGSVVNMFRRLGVETSVARDAGELAGSSAIVLPGIGAFDTGVQNLRRTGLFEALQRLVGEERVPILGICLGMQLLTRGSEEGAREGLALVPAETKRLRPSDAKLKVPHMGWNRTECLDGELFGELEGGARFYYVHSYHVVCDHDDDVAARCTYGARFTAALRRAHVMGTQFHPEKSHRYGLSVLSGFARAVGCARA